MASVVSDGLKKTLSMSSGLFSRYSLSMRKIVAFRRRNSFSLIKGCPRFSINCSSKAMEEAAIRRLPVCLSITNWKLSNSILVAST